MKTHPHIRADGSIAYFEISNVIPWSFGFMRSVLESVAGVTDFKKSWFIDMRPVNDAFVRFRS